MPPSAYTTQACETYQAERNGLIVLPRPQLRLAARTKRAHLYGTIAHSS
jgi:hypothetical protein